jgi:hypothetical protein
VIIATFTIIILLVGVALSWPLIQPLFLGLQNDDQLTNFFMDISGGAILIAIIISWFVFSGIGRGQ